MPYSNYSVHPATIPISYNNSFLILTN